MEGARKEGKGMSEGCMKGRDMDDRPGLLCRRRVNRWTGGAQDGGQHERMGEEGYWWVTGCLQGWMDRGMDAGARFHPKES